MRISSFRSRISILFSLILGLVLLLYAFFLYWGLSRSLYEELDRELRNKARVTQKVIDLYARAVGDSPRVVDYVFNRINFPEDIDVSLELLAKLDFYWTQYFGKLSMQEDLLFLTTQDGQVRGRSRRLSTDLLLELARKLPTSDRTDGVIFADVYYKNRMLRGISVPFVVAGQLRFLQIATSQRPVVQILRTRLWVILLSIPFVFVFMFLLGRFFAGQMLQPVLDVTAAAERISHRKLGERLAPPRNNEEMRRLVAAFNEMIGRLEKSFRHIEEFSSQVAHELRTPLAIMRGESEVALRKERSPQEYRRVVEVNLEETKRMLKTVEDLLLLARLDYHPDIFRREVFDFSILFREISGQARILGEEKNIKITLHLPDGVLPVSGDRLHLRRLFYNLIHNAVRFTDVGGSIVLSVVLRGERLYAQIGDSGCGIPADVLPRVFERFFRRDKPDSCEDPGNGLGLSIALAIARGHGGDIKAESREKNGSVFTVELPLAGQVKKI